ncbi:MAG: hypothetical protein GXY33_14640 [Phycisphaerae bacterium]|nr:hypothetical protein [Phycisphaerae bacterium]
MANFTTDHCDPNLHLFVDDVEVRQIWGLRRRLAAVSNSPEPIMHPGGPEAPWEDGRMFCPYVSSVVPDPRTGRLRMYYWCFGNHTEMDPRDYPSAVMACVAESDDGLHWQRPNLGLVEWRGSKDNNIFLTGDLLAQGDPDAIHDLRGAVLLDPSDPQRPYRMFAWGQHLEVWNDQLPAARLEKLRALTGYYLLESSDGLTWSPPRKIRDGGDTYSVVWDGRRRLWMWANRMTGDGNRLNEFVRLIEILESPDLVGWTRHGRAMVLGEEANFGLSWQHWGMLPFNYGDQYLAFLGVSNEQAQGIEIVLAASRDGRDYHLPVGKQRFLPVGELGDWNGETLNVSLNPPVRCGDRLCIYYTARNSDRYGRATAHNYLGVASLAVDRFVALSAHHPGFVLTEPIEVTAPRLLVNMQNTYGFVQVEVRDEENRPIDGYTAADCPKMQERSVAVPVRWNRKDDLGELVGRRCCLKFSVADAELYSFRFVG